MAQHEPIPLNVRIEDGSFNNRAPIGACAFFDPSDRSLVRGRAYVVLHDGHIMIRRYQAVPPRWVPDSREHYPSFDLHEVEVLGRVLHFQTPEAE
jgi:hypothetical protein